MDFKGTDFYRDGHVFFNKRIPRSFENIKSFADLGVKKQTIVTLYLQV